MDVACADGKLRPPMAGEWQDIAIAYACTVETVRRLVARMLIHGDIERSDINKPVFPAPLLQIEMYRVRNSQVSWLC